MTEKAVGSKAYDGFQRILVLRQCLFCKKEYQVPKNRKQTFCSHKCDDDWRVAQRLEFKCAWCGNKTFRSKSRLKKSKSGLFFCSRTCKDKAQQIEGLKQIHPAHYKTGIHNYRTKSIKNGQLWCYWCGYDKDAKMLDCDHIDGDRANNNLNNLQWLCVWCHALKTRKVPKHKWTGWII